MKTYCSLVLVTLIIQALNFAGALAVGVGVEIDVGVAKVGAGVDIDVDSGPEGHSAHEAHGGYEKSAGGEGGPGAGTGGGGGHEASTGSGGGAGTGGGGGHEAGTGSGGGAGTGGGGGHEAGTGSEGGDCKFSERGRDYSGKLSVTKTGKKCLNWEGHPNPGLLPKDDPAKNFPEKNLKDAKNYCRNGDNSIQGPWCFIDNEGNWEACKIPYCPENFCRKTKRESGYRGKVNWSVNGHKCLNWATQPNKKYLDSANPAKNFPEKNLEDAKDYCRNGDDSSSGPWCYIDDKGDYELCDIVYCPNDKCRFSDPGVDRYNGKQSKTASGKECLNWATHPTKKYLPPGDLTKYFAEKTLEDAKNYCRNGDRSSKGPWCYIDDKGGYESCDIPLC